MTELVQGKSLEIKYRIVPYTRGRGLDLACGVAKTWPHFIGVDNLSEWMGNVNHPELEPATKFSLRMSVDVKADVFDLSMFAGASMDFVFASYVLHLSRKPKDSLKDWWRVVKPGGHMVLYGPCGDENMDAHVIGYMSANAGGFDLVESELSDNGELFFQVYRKRSDRQQIMVYENKPSKTAAVVRYGAYGDMIQATSILTWLKDNGFHVTVITNPRGYEVVQHDPRIDAFLLQDTDQVPSEELGQFFLYWQKRFDKFVQLSESVEVSQLVLPKMAPSRWPNEARQLIYNADYLEMTHAIAGVPLPPDPRFVPTEKETAWAQRERSRISGKVAVWVSDGSSVHKFWPYMDNAIARILTTSHDWSVVIVGGEIGRMLEAGWENEPRVYLRCGKWSIRESLTFAGLADVVIGPETGVMNAVAMLDVQKILFLSHSGPQNLCKHWKNTTALQAKTGCRECHKLIYGWDQCSKVEKTIYAGDKAFQLGSAECQMNISIDDFWHAFLREQNVQKKAA